VHVASHTFACVSPLCISISVGICICIHTLIYNCITRTTTARFSAALSGHYSRTPRSILFSAPTAPKHAQTIVPTRNALARHSFVIHCTPTSPTRTARVTSAAINASTTTITACTLCSYFWCLYSHNFLSYVPIGSLPIMTITR
jgi:hypothetical protein